MSFEDFPYRYRLESRYGFASSLNNEAKLREMTMWLFDEIGPSCTFSRRIWGYARTHQMKLTGVNLAYDWIPDMDTEYNGVTYKTGKENALWHFRNKNKKNVFYFKNKEDFGRFILTWAGN